MNFILFEIPKFYLIATIIQIIEYVQLASF
jgi:hypothetical protein